MHYLNTQGVGTTRESYASPRRGERDAVMPLNTGSNVRFCHSVTSRTLVAVIPCTRLLLLKSDISTAVSMQFHLALDKRTQRGPVLFCFVSFCSGTFSNRRSFLAPLNLQHH